MKTTLVFLSFFAVPALYAQNLKEAEVPAAVKAKFASMFPDVKEAKWEKEQGMFEAEFKDNKVETSALFNSEGKYIEREVEIQVALLPQGVRDYVSKNLAGKKIDEATMITDARSKITYEAEVNDVDYLFDSEGKFLKKESEEENDTDKE